MPPKAMDERKRPDRNQRFRVHGPLLEDAADTHGENGTAALVRSPRHRPITTSLTRSPSDLG